MGNDNSTESETPHQSVQYGQPLYELTIPNHIEQNGVRLEPLRCNLADPHNPDSVKIRQPITELKVMFDWEYETPGVDIIDAQIRVHLWTGFLQGPGPHRDMYVINRPGKYNHLMNKICDDSFLVVDATPLQYITIFGQGCEEIWKTTNCHEDEIVMYLPLITSDTIQHPLYAFKIAPQ